MVTAATAFLEEELKELKDAGLYRPLRVLEGEQTSHPVMDGKPVITLATNNYLGLNTHPRLRAAARDAIDKYGVGSGAVRSIAGTMTLHQELEAKLAAFKHTEATLTLQSGYAANLGAISCLVGEGDVIVSDSLNHASIIDGTRLTKAERKIFPHKDMDGLEKALKESQGFRRKLVITDGVFSMDGDIAPLPDIVSLAERYGAITMVDDAHASGVLGRNGRGTVDHFDLNGRVDIQIGTLSKAIGALGGYAAGCQNLRDYLIQRARPFLFSTSHPPSVVATCIAAIDVLLEEPQLIERLWDNTRFFKSSLKQMGFNTGVSETPITPVMIPEEKACARFSSRLFEEGVFAQAILFPMVARGNARIRTIVTAGHTKEELTFCLSAFQKIGKELGVI